MHPTIPLRSWLHQPVLLVAWKLPSSELLTSRCARCDHSQALSLWRMLPPRCGSGDNHEDQPICQEAVTHSTKSRTFTHMNGLGQKSHGACSVTPIPHTHLFDRMPAVSLVLLCLFVLCTAHDLDVPASWKVRLGLVSRQLVLMMAESCIHRLSSSEDRQSSTIDWLAPAECVICGGRIERHRVSHLISCAHVDSWLLDQGSIRGSPRSCSKLWRWRTMLPEPITRSRL
jgi:hypothetical protein